MDAIIHAGVLYLIACSGQFVLEGEAQLPDNVVPLPSGPTSLQVSINKEAIFSCVLLTSFGDLTLEFVGWFLNGTSVDQENSIVPYTPYTVISATAERHFLEFLVDDMNAEKLNTSKVTCRGFYYELGKHYKLTNISEPAVLLIQGILSAPEILNTTIENGLVSIHWKPPFVYDGVDIDFYLFNVTAQATLGPGKVLTNNTTNQTKEEQSSIEEPYEGVCNVYNISVQAVSAAGNGHPAHKINFNETQVPKKLSKEEVHVNNTFTQDKNVTSTYTFPQDYCTQRRPKNFTLLAFFRNDGSPEPLNSTTIPDSDQTISLVMKVSQRKSTELDNVTIILENDAGSTEFDPISIEMSCVENITYHDESVVCFFVPGCVASGCKVVIECDQASPVDQMTHPLDLMRKQGTLESEKRLLPCDSIAMCTVNSVIVYALYDSSQSNIPDVNYSSIPTHVCSSSTVTTNTGPTSPTQSPVAGSSLDISLGVSLLIPFLLLIPCIVFPLFITA